MQYQKFKNLFLKELRHQLDTKYPDYEVNTEQIEKIGMTKTGIFLLKKNIDNHLENQNDLESTYVYYLEDIFEEYLRVSHATTFSNYVADFIDNFFSLEPLVDADTKIFTDKEFLLRNVFIQVTNYKLNENLKNTLPYRKFLDLMITYRLFVSYNIKYNGIYSSLLNNQIIYNLDISEEELYQNAIKNTDDILPSVLAGNHLTSDKGCYGSSYLICRDCLKQLKEDLYILPLDSDNLYIYKKNEINDINALYRSFADHFLSFFTRNNKPPMDLFLSTNIYCYDYKSDSLEILEV